MKINDMKEMLSSPQVRSFFLSKVCYLHARNCDVKVELEDLKVYEDPQELSFYMVFTGQSKDKEAEFLVEKDLSVIEEGWASFGSVVYFVPNFYVHCHDGINKISFGIKFPISLINARGPRAFMEWDAYIEYKEATNPYTRFEIMDI